MINTNKQNELIELFVTFMKIGGFTVGGGHAMIPIIQTEMVDKKKWVSEDEMIDYITLSQSMPGVVGINCATAVGYKVHGILGAISATLGMVTPSFFVIILVALVFEQFHKMLIVQNAFAGVRAAVVALILIAVIRIFKTTVNNIFQFSIAAITAIAILYFKIAPQYMILFAAVFSVLYNIKRKD